MDPRRFPPSLQRLWADEVLFLHSLWHQGPPQNPNPSPSSNPNPNPNPSPIPNPNPNPSPIPNPNPIQRPVKRRRRRKSKDQAQPSNPPASEIEWPVNPSPNRDAEPAGWPEPATNPIARPPVSAAEQARVSATLVQQTALKSSRAFFSKDGSDDDEMNEDEDDDDEEECRALEFFVGVFDIDEKLREYYAKHYEKGDFFCLVCEGIRVKLGRRYADCVGLVQHSIAISKTKRRGAHRGFGRAVCRVLGWDVKRLPNIVLDHREPMVDSLVKEGKMQDDVRKDDADEVLTDCIKEKRIETLDEEDVNNEKEEIPTHLEVSKEEERKGKEINLPAAEIVLRPCNPNQGQTPDATGLERNTPLQKQTPLAEEQAKVNAAAVQQKVLKACQNFLAKSDASSSSEDEDDDKNEVEKRESVALKFYSGLFSMNPELKNYYEKNHVKGEFFCLVCAAIGKRTWKRFGDCNGLVRHSLSIANTKKKWAHRAFGKAICQVLGCDVNGNLTVIIAPKESQAQPLEKPTNTG